MDGLRSSSQMVRFANALIVSRGPIAQVIADRVNKRFHFENVTPMIARTLVTASSKAIELSDPDVVLSWCRMARDGRSTEVVAAMVDTCFDHLVSLAPEFDIDVAALIVFLEIIRSRTFTPATMTSEGESGRVSTAISTVLSLLKARDEGTCTHSHATGMWAQRLCGTLGLDRTMTERIVRSAVLHDVGKIATPDAVLFKRGPLDEEEWSVMQFHAAYGADVLCEIPSLALYAPIVRAHHERIDGHGYPERLFGEEIPYEARVVSVADGFHAMTSDRPYRQALSIGRATAVLAAGRGTQWQAEIVDAMIATAISARNESTDAQLATIIGIGPAGESLGEAING